MSILRALLRETAAYALLALLVVGTVGAGIACAVVVDGIAGGIIGVAVAGIAAHALRRPAGSALGALVDGL